MVRLLLLVVMLLNLLNKLALVFVVRVIWITTMYLEIRLSLTNHHVVGGVVRATASLGLVGEGHILVVPLRNGCVCVVTGRLHELML